MSAVLDFDTSQVLEILRNQHAQQLANYELDDAMGAAAFCQNETLFHLLIKAGADPAIWPKRLACPLAIAKSISVSCVNWSFLEIVLAAYPGPCCPEIVAAIKARCGAWACAFMEHEEQILSRVDTILSKRWQEYQKK